MPRIRAVIDTVSPEQGRRTFEKTLELDGVPTADDAVEVARLLALRVRSVRWQLNGSALVFLGAFENHGSGITEHEMEITMPDYHFDALIEAGWEITSEG